MKKVLNILILGVILRIFLAATTFHPDIRAFDLGGRLVASGNIFNIYSYKGNLTEFIYPPAIYLVHGIFQFIYGGIFKIPFPEKYLAGDPQIFGDFLFNIHLLLLKTPYIFFDLMLGFLLMGLVSEKYKKLIFFLWIFNPINLYTTYMMGQFDVIPTFFTVLSLFFITRNKLNWAAIALGGGIAFKIYPVLLIVPLIILGKNLVKVTKLLLLISLPYLLSILPYLSSSGFRSNALIAGQTSKSLYANIPISGGEAIILFPTALIFIYLFFLKNRKIIWQSYLIILLLFFIFTHYHPQWFVWVTPFLILSLILNKFKNLLPVTLILLSWIGSLFFFDPSLTVNMFAPLFPHLVNVPSIWTLLHLNLDYNFVRSILQTVFTGAALYLIYNYAV